MRAAALMAVAMLGLSFVACGGGGGNELAAFRDKPEAFKGKTITATLTVLNPAGYGKDGPSIRDHPGKPMKFTARAGGLVELTVIMPEKADEIPNATASNDVVVTFVCEQGKLNEGNRATKITRP